MPESLIPSQPCFSMRLVRPFTRVLREYREFPVELLADLEAMDEDDRLPAGTLNELLRGAIAITGDENLGLKAARAIEVGDAGALEYAASSAATMGEAVEVLIRYMALLNDALTISVEYDDGRAIIRHDSAVVLPRASEDFQMGGFARGASFRSPIGLAPRYEVHFTHPEPDDVSEYALTFPHATVRFGQSFAGFVIEKAHLDTPLPTADPKLHAVIRKHADQLLAELPQAHSFTARVRSLLMQELGGGNPSAPHIAGQLHMSSRTLTRRLDQEGTSFKDLLEDLRKGLALKYVGSTDLALSEIAFLLGFSQVAAFHRAFKRWTSQTPLEHRRARRG